MRVLVVEDSERLRTYVGKALRKAGYAVDTADNGEDGLWLSRSNKYDAIVLDLMLPKRDGISLLKELRSAGDRVHVLILTARDTVEDRVHGLTQGADDYLVKPFAMAELLARVQALVRRSHGLKSNQIAVGDLVVDLAERRASRAGEVVPLTPREFALLEFLCLRRGTVVSRSEIEEHIYDEQVEPMSNVVDSTVCLLRKKIDKPGQASLIQTRRGMGYLMREP